MGADGKVFGGAGSRATDTYSAGSYDGKTEITVLCTGDQFTVY